MTDMTQAISPAMAAIVAKMQAQIDRLSADNAKLVENANKARGVTVRMTDSGGVGVFGGRLRKFGVSLYATEWATVIENIDAVKDIIRAQLALTTGRVMTTKSPADDALLRSLVS